MYALADCNNFFASCERVFRPELNGRPVIVLSNNDGCAVARSNEAKALGIKMGDPYFKLRPLIEQYGIAVFSSNFALYGDMSRRVQEVLRGYSPAVEPYSIDECFLDLSGMEGTDFDALAKRISRDCWRQTSIPVSVGIAPTKTLAKIASKLCKKYPKLRGGCYMYRPEDIEKVLRKFPAEDVWGIGRRSMRKLTESPSEVPRRGCLGHRQALHEKAHGDGRRLRLGLHAATRDHGPNAFSSPGLPDLEGTEGYPLRGVRGHDRAEAVHLCFPQFFP